MTTCATVWWMPPVPARSRPRPSSTSWPWPCSGRCGCDPSRLVPRRDEGPRPVTGARTRVGWSAWRGAAQDLQASAVLLLVDLALGEPFGEDRLGSGVLPRLTGCGETGAAGVA